MPSKNKRRYPNRILNRVISVLIVIMISGFVGTTSEIGFAGMLMIFGTVLVLMGSYAEGGSPTENHRFSTIDEQMVMYGARQNLTDEGQQRPNALFSLMGIGSALFVLGIIVSVTGITFALTMLLSSIASIIGLVYAYRKQIFYRDALTTVQSSDSDKHSEAIANLAEVTAEDIASLDEQDSDSHASSSQK